MRAPVRNPTRPPPEVLPSPLLPEACALTVATRPMPCSTLVCAVSGEVDMSTAPHLLDCLLTQVHLAGPDLVVDLGEVGFLGAAGLSVLVEVRDAAAAAGVGLCVVARTRSVLRSLTLTGLDLAFDVYPDIADVPARGRVR